MGIERWLEERYIQNFMKQLNDMDRSGIHVTELTSSCLRKIWYNLKMKEMYVDRELELEQAHIFWLGKKYHEVPMSNLVIKDDGNLYVLGNLSDYDIRYNAERGVYEVWDLNDSYIGIYGFELPVKYYDVRGQIDELIMTDDGLMILDKKTASIIPSSPHKNYIKQVEYYALMLKNDWNLEAKWGAILYIQKNVRGRKFGTKAFRWKLRDLEEIEKEFKEKVDLVREYLDKNELPPANKNKDDCRFCQWKELCFLNSRDISLNKKKSKKEISLDEFGWGSVK